MVESILRIQLSIPVSAMGTRLSAWVRCEEEKWVWLGGTGLTVEENFREIYKPAVSGLKNKINQEKSYLLSLLENLICILIRLLYSNFVTGR